MRPLSAQTARRLDRLTSVLFILPNLIGVAVFVVLPVASSFVLGFCRWRGNRLELSQIGWVGLANFARLLGMPHVWTRSSLAG